MALFVIEAVKFNAGGDRVESVRWGKVKGGEVAPPALEQTSVVSVEEVIEVLRAGDEVQTIFTDDTGVSFGPNLEIVKDDQGVELLVSVAHDIPNRSLADLPRI